MGSQIIDSFGRVHTDLRVSVTDRCNIRCFYCMPENGVRFLPRAEILTFEEMVRFVEVACSLGIDRVRITGGEPLVRAQLDRLVSQLTALDGLTEVALTTNGILLAEQADALRRAGLNRLNISLDTLDEQVFRQISRRQGLQKVLDGIQAAINSGFPRIRLNAISIAGLTEHEVVPLVRFAMARDLEIRFIEFMPLDAENRWQSGRVLSGAMVREMIERNIGPLYPLERTDPGQPAIDFGFVDQPGRVGFINPVTAPFCGSCNRLRLTAEGKVRNCLFSTSEWDARPLLRSNASEAEIGQLILDCVSSKKAGHGIDTDNFLRPGRAMYQIGG